MGGIGLFLPQVFGTGLPAMEKLLLMQVPVGTLVALKPAKIVATSLTLGSGGSGGVFAPCLFVGGLVGGAVGSRVHK